MVDQGDCQGWHKKRRLHVQNPADNIKNNRIVHRAYLFSQDIQDIAETFLSGNDDDSVTDLDRILTTGNPGFTLSVDAADQQVGF